MHYSASSLNTTVFLHYRLARVLFKTNTAAQVLTIKRETRETKIGVYGLTHISFINLVISEHTGRFIYSGDKEMNTISSSVN